MLPCIYYGIFCGGLTGLVIFLFKIAAKTAEESSRWLYAAAKKSPLWTSLLFAGLVVIALLMSVLHRKIPEAKGGGIPRSEGVLRGVLSFRWLKTLLGTIAGSMMSYVCGLPVGSEGPAVLIGTSLGGMCGSVSKNHTAWKRYVMTGGAGAGFAVATGSPLAGILFALEEIHKRFTPMLVLTVSVSVVSATCVNRALCDAAGLNPAMFEIHPFAGFELGHIGYLLLLGIVIALAVGLFDRSIAFFSAISEKCAKWMTAPVKLIAVFVITGILGLTFADGIYSGHDVIHEIIEHDRTAAYLLVLFVLRLLLMLFVTDSGATGGIFIPTLAIGSVTAALCAKLLIAIGMPDELFTAAVLLGMCAFIGGTLRAPLTASVLFVELTGQYMNLFYVALVVFTVNAVTELLHQVPFYDRALENIEHAEYRDRKPAIACFEMRISDGAFVVGKTVRDIMWPPSSVVIGITRADEKNADMDNDGEKKLYAGDTVVLRAKFFDEDEVRSLLRGLVGDMYEITRTEV